MRKSRKKIIVAIDGPAGSGKSTVAKATAHALKLPYIDTGAMYRALTWLAMREKVRWTNVPGLVRLARRARIDFDGEPRKKQKVRINGVNVTRAIRSPELTRHVHRVARYPGVRKQMVRMQRAFGRRLGGVLEGRDIGTVVFPEASYKFYLDADPMIRAKRRYKELSAKGVRVSLQKTARDLATRDNRDKKRVHGRLKRAKDAIYLDTSGLTVRQVINSVLAEMRH